MFKVLLIVTLLVEQYVIRYINSEPISTSIKVYQKLNIVTSEREKEVILY